MRYGWDKNQIVNVKLWPTKLMRNENPDYLVPIRAISTNHNEHLGLVWIAEQRGVE